jgi:hypothetical protein
MCRCVTDNIGFILLKKLPCSSAVTRRTVFNLIYPSKAKAGKTILYLLLSTRSFFDVLTSNLLEIIIDNESKICYIIKAVKNRCGLSPFFDCRIKYSEVYRSGHNGPDSKSDFFGTLPQQNLIWRGIEVVITGLTRNQFASNRTWVRIPSSPPTETA